VTRIELALSAWEADVLPLNYTRERHLLYPVRQAGRTRPVRVARSAPVVTAPFRLFPGRPFGFTVPPTLGAIDWRRGEEEVRQRGSDILV
jgi:hypothetical protein